jgi:hypothetical protein
MPPSGIAADDDESATTRHGAGASAPGSPPDSDLEGPAGAVPRDTGGPVPAEPPGTALEAAPAGGARRGASRIALVALAIALYPVAHQLLGFVPTVGALSLTVALLLRARPLPAALTALGAAVAIYLLFTRLLGVPL